MFNHAPPGYVCPFCRVAGGLDCEPPWTTNADVVFRGDGATAFVSAKWWAAAPGHVIVIPHAHAENLYDLSHADAAAVHAAARRVALALRSAVAACAGVSTRQHNEPAGNQDVWHYHLHVFPRFSGDRLYERHLETRIASPGERAERAALLRAALPPASR